MRKVTRNIDVAKKSVLYYISRISKQTKNTQVCTDSETFQRQFNAFRMKLWLFSKKCVRMLLDIVLLLKYF